MIKHEICCVEKKMYIKARVKERFFVSKEHEDECIFRLELYIGNNSDISFRIIWLNEDNSKETICHEEQKISDTRLEMLLKNKGLYAIEFDNTYSWINGKNVTFKLDKIYGKEHEESQNEKSVQKEQ